MVYRDTRNGTPKSVFLTLPRLVSGDRTDFGQKRYSYSYYSSGRAFLFPEGIPNPPPIIPGGDRQGFLCPAVILRFKFFKMEHYGGHMTTTVSPKKEKRRFRFSFEKIIFELKGGNFTFYEASQTSFFAKRSELHFFAKRSELHFLRSVPNFTFRESHQISLFAKRSKLYFLRSVPTFTFCESFRILLCVKRSDLYFLRSVPNFTFREAFSPK